MREQILLSALCLIPLLLQANEHQATQGLFNECRTEATALKPGRVIKVEMKIQQGREVYEFDIRDKDNRDWDIECDAATGKLVEVEEEIYGINDARFSEKMSVSYTEAKELVLKAYPGEIIEMEYEIEEDGTAVYEFDIRTTTGADMKVEIDASTGKVHEANREIWQVGFE